MHLEICFGHFGRQVCDADREVAGGNGVPGEREKRREGGREGGRGRREDETRDVSSKRGREGTKERRRRHDQHIKTLSLSLPSL
jgi:hypothetical protein